MPSLIDTHSHIYVPRFASDIDQVIQRAREAGVEKIVVPATKPPEFAPALDLAERYPEVEVAIGVHPHHAGEVDDADLEEVERLASEGRAIAIGEVGVDYYYEYAPRERQHEVFRRQLRIAKRLDLPAVVHNRDSDDDLLRIIEEEQDGSLRFQLHCFSSGVDVLRRALDLGAMISFTGNITYSKGTLDEVVRTVPDDRIMIETDAPYLTPVPYRGRRNEPAYVRHVAEKVAELRGKSLEETMTMTTDNARRFFRLAGLATLLLIAFTFLGVAPASAQTTTDAPVASTDSLHVPPRPQYDKWVGVGGLLASTSIISGALTDANSVIGVGFWLTATPLQSLGVDWLQLDLTYTHSINRDVYDSLYQAVTGEPSAPPNDHFQTGVNFRFIANPKSVINFYVSLGATYFRNEFGLDKWVLSRPNPNVIGYQETSWGVSGAVGFSLNIKTPYGLVSPTAEWYVGRIVGTRDLPHRSGEFFLSQPRIGILLYPALSKFF